MRRSKNLTKKMLAFTIPAVMAAQLAVSAPSLIAPVQTFAAVTTAAFDNSVGEYIPDGTYSYPAGENTYVSGGGRHAPEINIKSITVSGGKAVATISLTSGTYEYVTVEDDLDELIENNKKDADAAGNKISAVHPDGDHSEFTIPVKLNEDMRFCGYSSSVESWISPYVINISIEGTRSEKEIKRIIHYVDSETNEKLFDDVEQSASFYSIITVAGKENKITEEKIHWEPVEGKNIWSEVISPTKEGYTPSKEKYEEVKPNSKQGDVTEYTVKYTKNDDDSSEIPTDNGRTSDTPSDSNPENQGTDAGTSPEPVETVSDPDGDPDKNVDNGEYDVEYQDAESKRFNITKVVLKVENGIYFADITLSGTGYGYLYPGTAAEAEAAGEENWSPYTEGEDGAYTYTIKVPILNSLFTLASRSVRDGIWYDTERDVIIFTKDTDGNELPTHSTKDVTETESKTLMRTVKFVDANGERRAQDVVQAITYTRTKTVNGTDGSVSFTSWEPQDQILSAVESVEIPGMKPDKAIIPGYAFDPETDTENVVQSIVYAESADDNSEQPKSGQTDGEKTDDNNSSEDDTDKGVTKEDSTDNGTGDGSTAGDNGKTSDSGNSGALSGTKNTSIISSGSTGGSYVSPATGSAGSAQTSSSTVVTATAPSTGDNSSTGTWLIVSAASIGGIFAALFARKGTRKQRR